MSYENHRNSRIVTRHRSTERSSERRRSPANRYGAAAGIARDSVVVSVIAEQLDWNKLGSVAECGEQVLPVAVQNAASGEVIMVAYVSLAALSESLRSGRAVFFSTSKRQLHRKGETSGDVLIVEEVRVNCESNSLLFRVRLSGQGACHERDADGVAFTSCFQRQLAPSSPS